MIAYESMREKGVEGYCSKGKTIDYIFIIVLISFQLFILCTDPTRSSAFPFLSERNLLHIFSGLSLNKRENYLRYLECETESLPQLTLPSH